MLLNQSNCIILISNVSYLNVRPGRTPVEIKQLSRCATDLIYFVGNVATEQHGWRQFH